MAAAVSSVRRDGDAIVHDPDGGVLVVRLLAPGIVRVRAARDGVFRPRRSWAVTPPDEDFAPLHVDSEPSAEGLRLTAGGLVIEVGEEGFVRVQSTAGNELLTGCRLRWDDDGRVHWTLRPPRGRTCHGLGERTGLLDKSGRRYTCWPTDEWRHQGPETDSLYLPVPFLLVPAPDGRTFGVFLATTFRTTFDLRDVADETITLAAEGGELDAYVIDGPEPATVLERFTGLVGRMPLPPRWALGYHQSRWGYDSAERVLDVARELRARRIPADAVHLDIDHMDGARVFTWDRERFPDPPALVAELASLGLRTVCLVGADVKHEPGGSYAVYEEGHERDAFVRTAAGDELRGYVWPGVCVFPDFLRDDVREWWGGLYGTYVEIGVEGFLDDMNEPAMHDLPVDAPGNENIEPPLDTPHGPPQERVTHAEARNVYALLENEGAHEALRRLAPGRRPFLLTRSGFAGVQRHAGVFTGDQTSTWEHLEMSLPLILNLGLSGIPLAGTDIGGFFGNCDGELLVRWMQLGSLYPLARNHSAKDTTAQEPWAFGPAVEDACRRALELRYRLLPYLYGLFEEASRTGAPVLRPLLFHHAEDPRTHRLSDQALLGRDLLLAPVLRPGVEARAVYLPAGSWCDMRNDERYDGSRWILAEAPLTGELPLFARGGSVVPTGPDLRRVDERPLDPLTLHVVPDVDGRAEGRLYEDDGATEAYRADAASCETRYVYAEGKLAATRSGSFSPTARSVSVVVHGGGTKGFPLDEPPWEVTV